MTHGPRLRTRIYLVTASSLVALVMIEAFLAVCVPRIRPFSTAFKGPAMPLAACTYLPATTPKSYAFHHRTPEFDVVYRFNEFGYRGSTPTQIAKPANLQRILFVGDSFTLGWGNAQADTFVQRVADEFEPETCEVINAGFHCYLTPDAFYVYLKTEGVALEPDVIVVSLYSGNDLTEMCDNRWHGRDARGMPTTLSTIRLYTDHDGNFLFPPGARADLVGWNYRVPFLRESRVFVGVTQLLSRLITGPSNAREGYRQFGLIGESAPIEQAWQRFELTIKSINSLCSEIGARVVYAVIPPHPNISTEVTTPAKMSEIIGGSGAPVTALGSHLSARDYFAEGHLRPAGNRIVAGEIAALLVAGQGVRTTPR